MVQSAQLSYRTEKVLDQIEEKFSYPVFVKPAGTSASVGVSKAADRISLQQALLKAAEFDDKILVEEFNCGREVEVVVMGNDTPCGFCLR